MSHRVQHSANLIADYFNDLSDGLACGDSLYSDDTLIYQEVTTNDQVRELQQNINAVHKSLVNLNSFIELLQ